MLASNSPKKISLLYITTDLTTGGAERMLYNLLSKIDRLRFEPVVVSLMDRGTWGDRIENLGIPVYTINLNQGKPTVDAIWRLMRYVHHLKPNLIQGWMYHGNLAAQLANVFLWGKIPVFWSIHHSINSLNQEKRMTVAIINFCAVISKFTNKIIFVSKNSQIQHEAIGYSSSHSCVTPNGFDTLVFQPSSTAKLSVRAELGLAKECLLIGLIGRYHPMKDHPNFMRAAALLAAKNPDVHFILAGTELDSKNQGLLQLIQELGLINQIHLLGERHDIPRITAALDILTLASAYGEAFPLVVGEAMACGVPCVVTDVGDSAWLVGNTGRVVPPRNSEALASAWQELLVLNSESRNALGDAARTRIIDNFSLDFVVDQYESLYESALFHNKTV